MPVNDLPIIQLYFRCRKEFREINGHDPEESDLKEIRRLIQNDYQHLTQEEHRALPPLRRTHNPNDPWQGDKIAQIHHIYTGAAVTRPAPGERLVTRGEIEDQVSAAELPREVARVLRKLTPRETRVLRLRFGFDGGVPHTYDEIAQELGVTNEKVRQIETGAIRKLRHPLRSENLREFLSRRGIL